jgi:large subunit ribosomal protein L25
MRQSFVIQATTRVDQGKGASRRLRLSGNVPAIIYGGKTAPQMLTVNHNELSKQLKMEAFYSHILTVEIDGTAEQAVLKDLHRHPVREQILHLDLLRVSPDEPIRMQVPLHFKGTDVAPGVKVGGGVFEHHINQVEVECLPRFLPEYIEVDVSQFKLNDSIHLSQLPLTEGVSLVELKHGTDALVVVLHIPRSAAAEAEAAATPAAAAAKAPEAKKPAPKKK